jgi:hypothetical protein
VPTQSATEQEAAVLDQAVAQHAADMGVTVEDLWMSVDLELVPRPHQDLQPSPLTCVVEYDSVQDDRKSVGRAEVDCRQPTC